MLRCLHAASPDKAESSYALSSWQTAIAIVSGYTATGLVENEPPPVINT